MANVTPGEPISFAQAFELIHPHLTAVEERIREQAGSFDPAVEEYVSYVCGAGGKRLRPALALLSAGATGAVTTRHEDLAVILELIHIATLVHDDIMDGADIRRDQPTANARWGNAITVLLGDCLFAHALRLSTDFDSNLISRKIADAAAEVCSGEIIQTRRRFDWELSTKDYYRIIEMKTAALFSAACELGATLNNAQVPCVQSLKMFGTKLGVAYQIYDDILDLAGTETETGKTLGTDIRKGKFTLPILLLLQGRSELAPLRDLLVTNGEIDSDKITDLLREAGTIRKAIGVANGLLDEAEAQLAIVPCNPFSAGLTAISSHLRSLLQRF